MRWYPSRGSSNSRERVEALTMLPVWLHAGMFEYGGKMVGKVVLSTFSSAFSLPHVVARETIFCQELTWFKLVTTSLSLSLPYHLDVYDALFTTPNLLSCPFPPWHKPDFSFILWETSDDVLADVIFRQEPDWLFENRKKRNVREQWECVPNIVKHVSQTLPNRM